MKNKFVIAAKAIIKKENKFLILHRSETHEYKPGEADFPGGKLEFGETMEIGLLREIKEESNLEVKIIRPVRSWSFLLDEFTQIVGITYLTHYHSGQIELSYEHNQFKWLTLEEILDAQDFPEWIRKDFQAMNSGVCLNQSPVLDLRRY